MIKIISSVIFLTILLSACSTPAGMGTAQVVETGVASGRFSPTPKATPTLEMTATPEIQVKPFSLRDNFADLAVVNDYTLAVEKLAGKSGLAIDASAYSPDGRYVAYGGCTGNWSGHCQNDVFGPSDSFIYILDARTSELVASLPENKTTISGLSFSSDGNKLAYATSPAKVAVWDIPSGSVDIVLWQKDDGSSYGKVAFSPNMDSVAFVFDEYLYVWAYPDGKLLTQSPAFWYALDFPQFSADGKRLAVFTQNYGKALAVYDTDTWQVISKITPPGSGAHRAALSPDGLLLVTVEGKDASDIYLWDANTGGQVGMLDEPLEVILAMTFTPDGQLLFVSGYSLTPGQEDTFSIWDMANRQYLGGMIFENEPSRIFFSADGLTFFDNTHLWVPADEDILTARQVLEDYNAALIRGDYEAAAALFLDSDEALSWYADAGYDTSNIPEMLAALCASSAEMCLPFKTVRNGGLDRWGDYEFFVQRANPDGSLYVDQGGFIHIWLNVMKDAGGDLKVAGYPF
jgi:Tol biopolymer transport system component